MFCGLYWSCFIWFWAKNRQLHVWCQQRCFSLMFKSPTTNCSFFTLVICIVHQAVWKINQLLIDSSILLTMLDLNWTLWCDSTWIMKWQYCLISSKLHLKLLFYSNNPYCTKPWWLRGLTFQSIANSMLKVES